MRSQKVSTTLKVIFLAIDALLILAIAAAGYFCFTQLKGADSAALKNTRREIEALDANIAEVELQIDLQREAVAAIPTEDHTGDKEQLQLRMDEISTDIQLLTEIRDLLKEKQN